MSIKKKRYENNLEELEDQRNHKLRVINGKMDSIRDGGKGER